MELSDREQNQASSQEEKRNAPTVSREKWQAHAIGKMTRGYVLIVGTERRSANFYLPGRGYEMCAFDTAKRLIKEGIVVKSHDHYLGTAYKLADGIAPPPKPVPPPKPIPVVAKDDDTDDDDDMSSLLDELEGEVDEDLDDELDDLDP